MHVISHRGMWLAPEERNTLVAFRRSFGAGFGAEIDVRDLETRLVVSHDPPRTGAVSLDDVLSAHRDAGSPGTLAVNVKADGLADDLGAALASTPRWFAFDMSVPDALHYARVGLPFYTRESEHERVPALYTEALGVWLDCFRGDWVDESVVRGHLDAGKAVCLVSPELHGRPHERTWALWQTWGLCQDPRVSLCTDLPQRAREALA